MTSQGIENKFRKFSQCIACTYVVTAIVAVLLLTQCLFGIHSASAQTDTVDYAQSAPSSSGVMGTNAAGSARISASGAATHSIPIIVPPGTAGMAPQLSLSFSSQSQENGYLGLGWSVSGLPTIERCSATVADDGFRGGINFDVNDRFCLDGARLIAISAGSYGSPGMEYRTGIDRGVRVFSQGTVAGGSGPSYFQVLTKSGEVMEFGATADSKVEAQGKTTVRVWALNRKQDSSGNYLTVTYAEDNVNGDYRPSRIDYTGNAGLTPNRSMQFVYEAAGARPATDINPRYIGGSVVKSMQRLTSLRTYVGSTLVKDYRVSYEISSATKRSRVTQVQECVDLNPPSGVNCLPPTAFTSQNGGTTFTTIVSPNGHVWTDVRGFSRWIGDFNGDGKADLLSWSDVQSATKVKMHLSTGSGFVTQDWDIALYLGIGFGDYHFNWPGDYNGDGKTDMAIYVSASQIKVYHSNGTNFDPPITVNLTLNANAHWTYPGDYNGDGRTDLLVKVTDTTAHLYLANGTGFTPYLSLTGFDFGGLPDWNFVGDFDGDGKSDLAARFTSGATGIIKMHLANQTGTGFLPIQNWTANLGTVPNEQFLGDFNGDGKTDILRSNGAMNMSTGAAFNRTTWTHSFNANRAFLKLGDFNGDGRTDIASVESATSTEMHISTGTSFDRYTTTTQTVGMIAGLIHAADFDGDGKSDLINVFANAAVATDLLLSLMNGPFPDLVITINNGFGGANTFTYKPLTDSAVYATDAGTQYAAAYPNKEFQQPIYVVSSSTVTDGLGAVYPTTYSYGGGKMHQQGRGWLGFRWRETHDLAVKSRTKEFLNQTFPFIGTASESESYDETVPANPVLMAETWQTYNDPAPQPFPGVYYVQLQRADSHEWDGQSASRQSAKTLSYDTYNNPTGTAHLGDIAVANDQRTETTDWVVLNTGTTWLHRPTRTLLQDHLGNLLREKWLFYDNQAWGVLGTRGLVTREESRTKATEGLGSASTSFVTYAYDQFGNKISSDSPRVCPTSIAYETTYQTYPQTVTNCLNHQSTLAHDARFGVVTSQTAPSHPTDSPVPTTTSIYDNFGRLTKTTGPLDGASTYGSESKFYLDIGNPSLQRIATYRTEQHGTANYIWTEESFDGLRRADQTQQEGPGAQPINSETIFDSRGLVVQKSAPRFGSEAQTNTNITYDVLGRVTQVNNPDGTSLTKSYNRGLVTTINENGKRRDELYDVYGQLKQVIEYNSAITYTTNYTYDAAGSLLTVTNALGHVTAMSYDLAGRKTVMQDPNMGVWSYEYNRAGDLTRQTDARNIPLDFTYDELGRVKTKKQGTTTLATWTYDDATVAHSKGRLTRVVDSAADTRLNYDVLGRVTQTQRIIDGVTYIMAQSYDALGRITSESFPDNDTACYSYNTAGWLSSVGTIVGANCTAAGAYVTNIGYNARGQKLTLDYANGLTTTWAYFANNFRLQSRQTGGGMTHTPVALNRWVKSWSLIEPMPPPAGFVNLYRGGICVRDGAGNCIGGDSMLQAGAGAVIGYARSGSAAGTVPVYQSTCYSNTSGTCTGYGLSLSADGALAGYLSTTAPDSPSAAVPFIQSNGLLLQGLTGTASAFLWSASTQVVNHTDHYYFTTGTAPGGYTSEGTTAYIDDVSASGTVALVRYVNSTTGHRYYSTLSDPPSGFVSEATVGYLHSANLSGLVALYRHYNATTSDYLITTSSAPPGGYVMQATLGYGHSGAISSTHQNLAYTYDNTGNVKTITDTIWTGSRSFNYDDLNRLVQAAGTFGGTSQSQVSQDYSYDAIGNILTKAGVSYCYGYMAGCTDANGLSRVKSTFDGVTTTNYSYDLNGNVLTGAGRTFTWNLENRMDVVNATTGNAVMSYDYTGIRVKKSGSTGTTYFPFSGYEVQGGQATKYIKLGNEIIASRKGTSRFFYHNDHLGGVNIVSDANTAAQVQLNEYDPWGKVARSEGTTEPTHRFTGQELDPESGIHYYGGRYYDQNLARFVSPDPFIQDPDDPQNLNRYSYVINNPQGYIDPSGYEGFSFDYFFGGFSDFFSSFSGSSYQSQLQTAQSNNQFLSNTLYAGDCGLCGATNSYQIELTRYASDGGAGSNWGRAAAIGGGLAAGFIPGVGEAMDVATMIDPRSTGFERTLAGVSLAANTVFPVLPNFGAITKAGSSLSKWGSAHGGTAHWERVQTIANSMERKSWRDIRINRQQVDTAGNVVGRNRPDVSAVNPKTNIRHNIEIDMSPASSARHRATVDLNDASARNTYIVLPRK